ncbi:MAG: DUF4836 family protein [Bacteroides sp.]|nr:DUF4836 family protein [Bacteroides sp.]
MKKISFLVLFVTLLTLGFSSCSSITGEDELTGYIPGDAAMVMKLDCKKLFEASDVKVDGDKVELPSFMKKWFNNDEVETLSKLNNKLELDKVFMAINGEKDFIILVRTNDFDGLCKMLEEDNDPVKKSQDDYTVYTSDNFTVAVYKQKYVFVKNSALTIADFKTLVEKIKKNPLSKYPALAQAVSTDDAITFAVNYEQYMALLPLYGTGAIVPASDYIKGKFMAGNINFVGNKALFDGELGNIDGSPVKPVASMDDINIALLSYVPEDYNIVFAAGKVTMTDNDYYDNLVKYSLPQLQGFVSMMRPYLESIDGSSMMAFRIDPALATLGFNPEYFDAILMIHMPMEKIREAVSNLMTAAGMYGLPAAEISRDMYAVTYGGITIYFGASDGYLAISTQPVSATHSPEFAKYFVNRKSAAVIDGSCLKGLLPFSPFAVMQSDGATEFKAEVTLEDTTDKFIPALMQLAR